MTGTINTATCIKAVRYGIVKPHTPFNAWVNTEGTHWHLDKNCTDETTTALDFEQAVHSRYHLCFDCLDHIDQNNQSIGIKELQTRLGQCEKHQKHIIANLQWAGVVWSFDDTEQTKWAQKAQARYLLSIYPHALPACDNLICKKTNTTMGKLRRELIRRNKGAVTGQKAWIKTSPYDLHVHANQTTASTDAYWKMLASCAHIQKLHPTKPNDWLILVEKSRYFDYVDAVEETGYQCDIPLLATQKHHTLEEVHLAYTLSYEKPLNTKRFEETLEAIKAARIE